MHVYTHCLLLNFLSSSCMIFDTCLDMSSLTQFDPDDVEKLRSHQLPLVSGVCAKKGRQAIASNIWPGTESFEFGTHGKLYRLAYAGTGFLHVRREVYETIQLKLNLPVCNELFGGAVVPFFRPLLLEHEDSTWYLAEDFSFSQRARECGFDIMADTSIRLWHVGSYLYGWEDACNKPPRYTEFTMEFNEAKRATGNTGPNTDE